MTPVILPASLQEARRPIAGLAAVSRVLIEFGRAGRRTAIVALEPSPQLAARVGQELERAGCELAVTWVAPEGLKASLRGHDGDLAALGCAVLLRASLLARFFADPGLAAIRSGGQVVAVRTTAARLSRADFEAAEGAGLDAAPGEAVPMDRPYRAALAILSDTGKSSDGWVSRRLNRPVSRRLSSWLLGISGLRPSHLTAVGAAAAAAMFASLAFGGRAGLVVGCVLLHLASVLDGLDGEVARATFRSSSLGALLDTAVDMATNLLFVLGLSLGLARIHAPSAAAGMAALALWTTGVLLLAVLIRLGPRGGSFDVLKIAYGRRLTGPVGSVVVTMLRNLLGRDFFAFAFAVMGLLGLYGLIPWIVLVATGLWLLLILAAAPMLLTSRPGLLQPDHLANGGRGLQPQAAEP